MPANIGPPGKGVKPEQNQAIRQDFRLPGRNRFTLLRVGSGCPAAPPLSITGKCIGQATEFQAGKETPGRRAEEAQRREAAGKSRSQRERAASAETLNARREPRGDVPTSIDTAEQVIAATRAWLEKAVIGLQLCPFAARPYLHDRVRYRVSEQRSSVALLEEFSDELRALRSADLLTCETTLLIHPQVLHDFRDYNDFLQECEAAVADLGFEGDLQVAGFHPLYQFSGTRAQDIENCTNRSPYPMLHLLREDSVARAVASFPDVHAIGAKNIGTLRRLGHEGWRRLWLVE